MGRTLGAGANMLKRLAILWILVGIASAFAQNVPQDSFHIRLGFPLSIGVGYETFVLRNMAVQGYTDVNLDTTNIWLGGDALFKPNLGEFNKSLNGLRPYIGGGAGLEIRNDREIHLGLSVSAGLEYLLDKNTGIFGGWHGYYPAGSTSKSYFVLGFAFRGF